MEKKTRGNKIITLICGLGIIITTIIMSIRLEILAYDYSMHPERSLGVAGAVQITAIQYGIVICIFTIILVLVSILKKSK